MKKTIIMAALGMVAASYSSFAQGYVVFSSYVANGNVGATTSLFSDSSLIGAPFTAELYYFIGTISDSVNMSDPASIYSLPTGLQLLSGVSAAYANSGSATAGYFDGGTAVIPGYTSGPITFEIVAFNGADYASSTIRGRSGTFTMNSIAASSSVPASYFGDNGQIMPNFFVATPVPEPSTLALAGLGGFGMLMALRRKKA